MKRSQRWRTTLTVGAAAGAALILGSCSVNTAYDSASSTAQLGTGYPVVVNNCGFTQTFTEAPKRVLLLQGASVGEATTLIELGVAGSVLASAQHYGVSDIPGMAAKVDALPKDGLKLNAAMDVPAEQVLARRPDLVISTWSGGFDPKFGFASRQTLEQAGIRTLVNPVNCAYGKAGNVTTAEKTAYENGSVVSSLEFITLMGRVYGVEDRAKSVVDGLRDRIRTVGVKVVGKPKKKMLIAYPDMSVMNSNGLPAVFSGNIYDSVVRSAGGEPSFPGGGSQLTSNLSAEQLAAAEVDVLVIGAWRPGEDLAAEARKLFAAYPQWSASKTKTFVAVSDGPYLGPANAAAIEKIAKVAHPDAGW
ncbi:ABC transporter substrate-binding protein [Gordonia crocea]|uniref:Fe/B12 periplasmic-binding domain-containing protein n=1 Tax=Gordonia crocea TaxID=589162 RepID=A0A7I9V053_9ACTN|nr:ABC transporter substrate-binding protein [Gordonia crocea]GED98566.1 hypothetical protein nbrc107697_26050 [Gordonia crocea]